MEIRHLSAGDLDVVLAAGHLFDEPPSPARASRFLGAPGHHLLLAVDDEDRPGGFVTGVEMHHPDKGTEMFLYELGVDEEYRGRGIGRLLVTALAELAERRNCYDM